MFVFFEIRFVEHEKVFYQLGNLPLYTLTCELFEYSHEDIDTGVPQIDDIENEYSYSMDLVFDSGSGNFKVDETITNGDTTGKVLSWNYSTKTLRVGNIVGSIITSQNVIGQTSGANWTMVAAPSTLEINTDRQANNFTIQSESDSIFDFSDRDPFSEGQY